MKYFEAAACNTLLVAPHSQEVRDLGFVPSVHFIEVDENSFLDKAKYYAKNYERFGQMIALNGFTMVKDKHSVEVRAQQLVNHVLKIIG
jgi:spore maturation protein CgeB